MSKNTFRISGDVIYISRPEWDFIACATVREDYKKEIQEATWGLQNGRYLYTAGLFITGCWKTRYMSIKKTER